MSDGDGVTVGLSVDGDAVVSSPLLSVEVIGGRSDEVV